MPKIDKEIKEIMIQTMRMDEKFSPEFNNHESAVDLFDENVFARHNPGSQGQLSADPARPRLMCESDLQSERGRARALQLSLRMRTTRRGFEPVRPEL